MMRAQLALGTVKMLAPSSNFKQTTLAPRGVLLNRRPSAACRASRSTLAMAKNKKKFYGVKVGRVTGVYEAWDEAEAQVKGYDGALHKSFATRAAAEKYVASPPAPGFVTRRRSSDKRFASGPRFRRRTRRRRTRRRWPRPPPPSPRRPPCPRRRRRPRAWTGWT